MQCFEIATDPGGSFNFPSPVTCSATPETSSQLVMMTQTEYVQISTNPFNVSIEDGQALVTAMLLPITIAYVFRLIIRAIHEFSNTDDINQG